MKIRSLFASILMAVAVITGCEQVENLGTPKVEVSPQELSFTEDISTQTIQLTATRPWTAQWSESWIEVVPDQGEASAQPQTITVKVLANAEYDRSASVKFDIGMDAKNLKVKQSGTKGSADALVIYSNDFDKEAALKDGNYWPYPNQSECWMNQTGTGVAQVVFGSKNVTIRNNSNSTLYQGASGLNNVFFGKVDNYFAIGNISLPSDLNYTLDFGTIRNLYDASDNTFVNSEFHVWLSNDGAKWVELQYAFADGPTQDWNRAKTTFTVPQGTKTLYLAFTADLASSYRLDDLELGVASEAGTKVDFASGVAKNFQFEGKQTPPEELGKVNIASVIAASDDSTVEVEALVVAEYTRGFLLKDDSGMLLVYAGEGSPKATVGDKVNVKGTKTTYAGMAQVSSPEVNVLSSGNEVVHPQPKVLDGAAMDNLLSSSTVEYIQYTGILEISGYYYNVNVSGAQTAIGSVSYPSESLGLADKHGKEMIFTGYFIGVSSGKYINTMVTDATATGNETEIPDQPASLKKVTVQEFIDAAPDSDTWYELTGEIMSITSAVHGNFYIKDETAEVLVYGMTDGWVGYNDLSFEGIGLKVGDVVTLGTLRGEHNGSPQAFGDYPAFYISHVEGEAKTINAVATLTFPDENMETNKISGYDKEWEAKVGAYSWKINGFNNNNWNNNWSYIRCGRKAHESEGVIATAVAIKEAVDVVVVTFDKCDIKLMKTSTLTVAKDAAFTDVVETVTLAPHVGELMYEISAPGAGYYYKLSYPCANPADNGVSNPSNGFGQLSKIVYGTVTE